jgi:NADH-quinone oxidoreductase subunit K
VTAVPTSWFLLLGAILFVIGAGGVLLRRNVLIMLMCVEMMMNAVNLTFIALSRQLNSLTGQVFVFMIMAVAAVEVAVGLAILIELNRLRATTDVDDVTTLRDSNT